MKKQSNNDTIISVLALCHFSAVQPRLLEVLITHFGYIDRILKADAGSLMSIPGMTADIANGVADASSRIAEAKEYLAKLHQDDIKVVSRFDDTYPQRLFELNDPPALVYYRGVLPDDSGKVAALAGAEKASNEGIELTVEMGRQLAGAGVQVVTSLNPGIDSAAHIGAKAGAGKSFSVLQSGLDKLHPEDNHPLAIDIIVGGGLLSEYPPQQEYQRDNYRSSNRIIAALSQAVVVTELYKDSNKALDLLKCCSQIGKLAFILIDPRHGALTDKEGFDQAVTYGAIPMVGLNKVDDIIQSLV